MKNVKADLGNLLVQFLLSQQKEQQQKTAVNATVSQAEALKAAEVTTQKSNQKQK
jgi:hypothetical protein